MAVIVIPERRGPTSIVIFITILLPRYDKVCWKAIEFWPRHPSVQVNHAGCREVIGKGDECFSPAPRLDRWTRKCAVVTPDSRTQPWDKFSPRFLLAYLVVVGGGVCTNWRQDSQNWQ